jgi:hypothetical protein
VYICVKSYTTNYSLTNQVGSEFSMQFGTKTELFGNKEQMESGAGDGNRTHVRTLGARNDNLVISDRRVRWIVPELSLNSFQLGAFPGGAALRRSLEE